jgi:tetratricopeptide (TPR) repeat protein
MNMNCAISSNTEGGIRNSTRAFLFTAAFITLLAAQTKFTQGVFAQTPSSDDPEIARLEHQADIDLHNQEPLLAIADYQRILAIEPHNLGAHSNLGLAYYMHNDFAQAVGEFRIVLKGKPDLWNIVALCGIAEAKVGQNPNAIAHLSLAFQHVDEPSLRLAAGKELYSILLEAGDLNQAADVVDKLQLLDPKSIDVLYAEHQVHSLLADKAFVSMAQLEPDSARMFELRGDRMAQNGNLEGAIAAYRAAIARNPHVSGIHFALAEVLSVSRNAADRASAEDEYRKALVDDPSDEKAECRLGDIDAQRSKMEDASQHYKRAIQLQPNDPDANEGYGMVLLTSGSIQEARIYLNRAVQLDPTSVTAYYHLSQASRKAGDIDEAKSEMEQFLKLKAARESLKREFNDLPRQSTRQSIQDQKNQIQPR